MIMMMKCSNRKVKKNMRLMEYQQFCQMLFMGRLLPSCAILYEEGCSFVKGKKQPTVKVCPWCGVGLLS